jgi:WD40 repeat protein
MSSDLRIMGFDVSERVCYGQPGVTYEIVMAYSDSTVQRWSYDCSKWSSRGGGDYLTACLTDVRSLSLEYDDDSCTTSRLLTTATDGHIALWESRVGDGLNWLLRQKVHQNAILDAASVRLSGGSTLLVTAGDDNGLGFSRVHAERFHDNGEPEIATLLIPRAHAAAVTALAMYKYDKDSFYVLSASIDQRVKLWDVRVVVTARGVDRVKVSKVQNVSTSVADVSSMALLQLGDGCKGVLVSGVGMDVWRIQAGVAASKVADE